MAQFFYFLGHEQFQPEILVNHAILAEQAGFDGVCVSEHFTPWVADVGAAGFALSTLGAIAAKTTKLQMMSGVITPLFRYHPAIVAQAVATIDRLSNGRFSLGIGSGESINETQLGYVYPAYAERAERIREAIKIIKSLLKGEKISLQGKYYQTVNAKLYSPPVHDVPVYLAAAGPKSASLAGEYTDGMIVSVKEPEVTMKNVILPAKEALTTHKHPFHVVATRWTIFANSDEEAWNALRPWRGLRAPHRDTATDPITLQEEADALPKEEIFKKYVRVKSAEEYIAAYQPLIQTVLADTVVIQTTRYNNQEKLIQMLGSDVLPTLRKLT